MLANVSVDYYERLEQARSGNPSESTVGSLARALRLSLDERDYLYQLAGYLPPPRHAVTSYVEPAMMFLLDSLTTVPAHVIDESVTVLAQNELSRALLGPWADGKGRDANVIWRWFTDLSSRRINVPDEHEAIGRGYVADLRTAFARHKRNEFVGELITDLLETSSEFARYWESRHVAALTSTRKVLNHPRVGLLDVQCDFVLSTGTGQRLVLFRPQPGSATAENFDFLRVLGGQKFENET